MHELTSCSGGCVSRKNCSHGGCAVVTAAWQLSTLNCSQFRDQISQSEQKGD
jgi:hypothetical protein